MRKCGKEYCGAGQATYGNIIRRTRKSRTRNM